MKVPKTFVPEKSLENKVRKYFSEESEVVSEKYLLVLAKRLGGYNSYSSLYFWNNSFKRLHFLRGFNYLALSLCLFKEEVYLGLHDGAIIKLPGEKFVTKRPQPVSTLCVHDDKLYDAGGYSSIFETLTDKAVRTRYAPIRYLYSYSGIMYDCGLNSYVYNTFTDKEAFCKKDVSALFCDGKHFYGGTDKGIMNLSTHSLIAKRDGIVNAIGEHDGVIYDAGKYPSVFSDFSDFPLFDLDERDVCVVDTEEVSIGVLKKLYPKFCS